MHERQVLVNFHSGGSGWECPSGPLLPHVDWGGHRPIYAAPSLRVNWGQGPRLRCPCLLWALHLHVNISNSILRARVVWLSLKAPGEREEIMHCYFYKCFILPPRHSRKHNRKSDKPRQYVLLVGRGFFSTNVKVELQYENNIAHGTKQGWQELSTIYRLPEDMHINIMISHFTMNSDNRPNAELPALCGLTICDTPWTDHFATASIAPGAEDHIMCLFIFFVFCRAIYQIVPYALLVPICW